MIYCELNDEWKQDIDTCFDFDKDELVVGFDKNKEFDEICKNCSNREVEK